MIRKDCDDCIKRKTMYCPNSNECYNTFEKPFYLNNIKALDQLEQKENIIKEIREKIEMKIKGYKEIINTLIYSSVENKRYEITELKYRIGEQEELLEILDKDITKKSDYNYEKVEKENKE